jgi:hypothetical protein
MTRTLTLSFDAIAGTTYYFAIGAFEGSLGGHLKFTVDLGLEIELSINRTGSVTKEGIVQSAGS